MSAAGQTRPDSNESLIETIETTPKSARISKGPTLTYNKMLFFALFFLLLMNPVFVSTQSVDERAAVADNKETTTPKLNSHQINEQSNTGTGNQKNEHVANSNVKSSDHINCTLPKYINTTLCKDNKGMVSYILEKVSSNSGMLFRTMYVLLAVTGVVIIYFVIKAIRLRRRRSKSRKYGIITKQGDRGDMEMEPLGDGADEDDDYTVFEMSRRK